MPPAIDGQQAMRQFVKCCVSSPPHQFDLASVGERVSGTLERDDLAAGMGLRQEVREIERRYLFERCQDRALPFSHGSPRAAYNFRWEAQAIYRCAGKATVFKKFCLVEAK